MSKGIQPGYNKCCAVFSPKGRLLQVEYAISAVNQSNVTTVAVRGADCAVVATQRINSNDELIVDDTNTQLYTISNSIGCCMTGQVGDSRALMMSARYEAINYLDNYQDDIPVELLVDRLGDTLQVHTQNSEVRPYGCCMILISYCDEIGPSVYKLDPSAQHSGYLACAVGAKGKVVESYLDRYYKHNMSQPWVIGFAVRSLMSAVQPKTLDANSIEIGLIGRRQNRFRRLGQEEVEYHCWNNTDVPAY